MFVLDSHCDTPSQIYRGRDVAMDNDNAHVDFPKLRRGGVDGAFFALYISPELNDADALDYALKLYDCMDETLKSNAHQAALTVSKEQAYANKEKGIFSVFLGLENGSPIGRSLDILRDFYAKGVRYMTLCHSENNEICDSCATAEKRWHGLSPFGREVVAEMNRLGMLVDVSHISDEAFYDVIECSTCPVVATHSCCRALAGHPRNMTDDMIRALAAKGGVIQVNFYPYFLVDGYEEGQPAPSYKVVADHIDHVVKLVGINHVGIGSDFDGIEVAPEGLDDISMMPVLFEELRSRGYSEEDLEKIASGNFFNAFSCSGVEQS
jgi:membrane dipeptidase